MKVKMRVQATLDIDFDSNHFDAVHQTPAKMVEAVLHTVQVEDKFVFFDDRRTVYTVEVLGINPE